MNAFEIPSGQFTLVAATAIDRHCFIKVNANGNAEYATAATDPIVGVSYMDTPKAGTPLSIAGSGIVMVEASETIAPGDFVVPTTNGAAAKSTASETKPAAGFVALTGAGKGQLITVKLS